MDSTTKFNLHDQEEASKLPSQDEFKHSVAGGRKTLSRPRGTVAGSSSALRGSLFHGSRLRSTVASAHRPTVSADDREKVFFLIPREVKITFGPYFHLGILDYRTERLKGLQRVLKKCGAAVQLKPTFHINEVRAWHLEQPFFSCNITDLQHGGDGELDHLCKDAGRGFEKSVRRAYINLKERYHYETTDLRTGCPCEHGTDPAFSYYEAAPLSSAGGSSGRGTIIGSRSHSQVAVKTSASIADLDEEEEPKQHHHHHHEHHHHHRHEHEQEDELNDEKEDEEEDNVGKERKHSHSHKHRHRHSRHKGGDASEEEEQSVQDQDHEDGGTKAKHPIKAVKSLEKFSQDTLLNV